MDPRFFELGYCDTDSLYLSVTVRRKESRVELLLLVVILQYRDLEANVRLDRLREFVQLAPIFLQTNILGPEIREAIAAAVDDQTEKEPLPAGALAMERFGTYMRV